METYIALEFVKGKICIPKWGLWKGHGGYIEIGLEYVIDEDDYESLLRIIEKRKNELYPEVESGCLKNERTYVKMGYKSFSQFAKEYAVIAIIVYDAKTEFYVSPRGSRPEVQDKYELNTTDTKEIATWVFNNRSLLH